MSNAPTPTPPPEALGPSLSKSVCSVCRQRKVACDRRRPRCGLCQKHNFECEYISTDRRPGLRAGFVSRLEQRLVELETRVKHLELKAPAQSQPAATNDVYMRSLDHAELHNEALALSPFANSSTPSVQSTTTAAAAAGTDVTPTSASGAYNPGSSSVETGEPLSSQVLDFNSFNRHPNQRPQTNTVEGSDHAQSPRSSFDPLLPSIVIELCTVWFEKYHQWFPILHQPSLLEAIRISPNVHSSDRSLVIKAILAVTIHHCQSSHSTPDERVKWSEIFRDSILVEATGTLSLRSLQALLILSNNEYGAGRMGRFWNFIALCKRLSLQLGLRDVVTSKPDHSNNTGSVPPRILPLPNTIIDQEERIRAYWMTEMLDSMSTLGARWNAPQITPPPPDSVLPCSDSLWAFHEHIINLWSFGEFKYSSAFSLCNILVASEFGAVHHSFLKQPLSLGMEDDREAWRNEAQQLDERLTNWREEFVAAVFRLINAEFAQEERAEMEPNIVLTNCLLNTAVIVLFESLTPYPIGVDRDYEPWAYATNRCVYASDNMAAKVRRINDEELRICNPHLVLSIFTAARFYIVYSKAVDANVPTNLYSLAYALNMCGQRWAIARRYEAIIRAAAAEHKTSVAMSSLPVQFFDLRYSVLDLENTLAAWYDNLRPDLGELTGFLAPARQELSHA